VVVPRIWDAKQLADWATPLAGLNAPPSFYSEEEYYAAPIDNLRTYPLYHPRFEPANYRQSLLERGPQPLIEPEKLRTRDDWIKAGQRVFDELDTEVMRSADPTVIAYFTDAAAIDAHRDASHDVISRDGIMLDYRWIVEKDGTLKVGVASCSGCHSRLLPDGSVLPGAPCNFDLAETPAASILLATLNPPPRSAAGERFYDMFGVPWLADDPHGRFKRMTDDEMKRFNALEDGAPPGTMFARFNGSPLFATRMADLRGVKDRRYLDATATHKNRGPEDIARYGILVEFADSGVFGRHKMTPEVNQRLRVRPPDEAMYALGLYIYSLESAKSPHAFDDLAKRGQKIFESEGCTECHTPPHHTNNKLVAVPGFEPPADAADRGLNVSNRRVRTDPGLALSTRKGTGYYKIPSLRGLWYRGLYEHNGSVASLEDWFDPKRLRDDYEPTGWKGPGVKTRAVPGHNFGLDLSDEEKKALIAFLRTL
jgi:mono/diheme cytochrome c family protein